MKLILEDSASNCLEEIFDYNSRYSHKNAVETDRSINNYISNLKTLPLIGRTINEIDDTHFRELIYRKHRNSYRILYYISEIKDSVYILYVTNSKKDFNQFLKLHNYFKNYFKF